MSKKSTNCLGIAAVCIGIAAIAFPLCDLMIADLLPVGQRVDLAVDSQVDGVSQDAVSALMAGNVVGDARDCSFGLRIPASAFIP